MQRRGFIQSLAIGAGVITTNSLYGISPENSLEFSGIQKLSAPVLVAGGGLGGVAAALALLRNGEKVILTEETDWIGGQLTSQAVPPDEHSWIETHGAPVSYRVFRDRVRAFYKENYPLVETQLNNPFLNPGNGSVSRLCHEPKVAVSVLERMLYPYVSSGQLTLLLNHKPISSEVSGNSVRTVTFRNVLTTKTLQIDSSFFIDATELGDLLPLTGTEYVKGTESKQETGELHAPEFADPQNQQAFTTCFVLEHLEGEDFVQKPKNYNFWANYTPAIQPAWSGKLLDLTYSYPKTLKPKRLGFDPTGNDTSGLLNLWNYRKLIDRNNFKPGFYKGDISLINWPQNDYMLGNLIDVSEKAFKSHVESSKDLGRALLYWLQTEAPRTDGKKGWPGLRLRPDIMGTEDGFAKYPYIRESRRIKAEFTVTELHVGKDNRVKVAGSNEDGTVAAYFKDSVGVGYYHIDLHPTTKVNYIDFSSLRFQIPLGALLPIRMDNIFPANKNIGTTHITNGCYRLHPVEWSIGEAVALLIVFAKDKRVSPKEVRKNENLLKEFQKFLHDQGVETEWKD